MHYDPTQITMSQELTLAFEPSADDWTTNDHRRFYAWGRLVLALTGAESIADMWKAIDREMSSRNYFPNVWFVSDHGNIILLERP